MKFKNTTFTFLNILLLLFSYCVYLLFAFHIIAYKILYLYTDLGFSASSNEEAIAKFDLFAIAIASLIILLITIFRGRKMQIELNMLLAYLAMINLLFVLCGIFFLIVDNYIHITDGGYSKDAGNFILFVVLSLFWYLQASLFFIKPKLNIVQNKIV